MGELERQTCSGLFSLPSPVCEADEIPSSQRHKSPFRNFASSLFCCQLCEIQFFPFVNISILTMFLFVCWFVFKYLKLWCLVFINCYSYQSDSSFYPLSLHCNCSCPKNRNIFIVIWFLPQFLKYGRKLENWQCFRFLSSRNIRTRKYFSNHMIQSQIYWENTICKVT